MHLNKNEGITDPIFSHFAISKQNIFLTHVLVWATQLPFGLSHAFLVKIWCRQKNILQKSCFSNSKLSNLHKYEEDLGFFFLSISAEISFTKLEKQTLLRKSDFNEQIFASIGAFEYFFDYHPVLIIIRQTIFYYVHVLIIKSKPDKCSSQNMIYLIVIAGKLVSLWLSYNYYLTLFTSQWFTASNFLVVIYDTASFHQLSLYKDNDALWCNTC